MLRLIGIVISIGLADSLNPSTIAPALYLATGERARERVAEFTMAVFARLFRRWRGDRVRRPAADQAAVAPPAPPHRGHRGVRSWRGDDRRRGAFLWRHRDRLSDRDPPHFDPHGRSSWLLGASITAIELPTAFPYFAAIAAIVGSGLGPVRDLVSAAHLQLLLRAPADRDRGTLTFGGDQADRLINAGRGFLQEHWPAVLAGLALVAGVFVALLGATGIAASHSSFIRRLHRTLHG